MRRAGDSAYCRAMKTLDGLDRGAAWLFRLASLLAMCAALSGCDHRSASEPRPSFGADTSFISRAGSAIDDDVDEAEKEELAEEAETAKAEFESAADELNAAVRALAYNDWPTQMSRIRSRLDDAESALDELERLRPDDAAVSAARDEVDAMRRHTSRLHLENWRDVAPDLRRSAGAIEGEAGAVSTDPSED